MNQHHPAQWDNIIIERKMDWEDGPEGRAVLLVPRFRWGPLAKWLQPRLRKPHIRVKLDDIGSFVWKRCNGKTTFREIAKAMKDEFGEQTEPTDDRLMKFLLTLQKNKFAKLYQSTEA